MKLSVLAEEIVSPDPDIAGLAVDSRLVEKGFLFAAMPGEQSDGRQFIPQAEKKGAAGILSTDGAITMLPLIVDDNPRKRLSRMASIFYDRQPAEIFGITGTNGKTSTARFVAQLFSLLGKKSGSIGTLGAQGDDFSRALQHTTPEPITLHETLHDMAEVGVAHVAMEVSSHALAQHRADGVQFSGCAFINITQDHLDYHADFDDYFEAKARLFVELAVKGSPAVINMDGAGGPEMASKAREHGLKVFTTGRAGTDLRIENIQTKPEGLLVNVQCAGRDYALALPLIGAFQAENALVAAGIVIASGVAAANVLPLLPKLCAVPGRMQLAAEIGGAHIYVDYAHTPDAIATALQAAKPHARGRVIVIVGAGGDRDRSKRPLMGAAAAAHADLVIVTDDNPRNESPETIRRCVIEGCPDAIEVADRASAIAEGVRMLHKGDILLIAGKGHEQGQVVGTKILPFDDVAVAKAAVATQSREMGV